MGCPKCSNENLLGDECPKCGIYISKYLEVQTRKKTSEQENERDAINNASPESSSRPISLTAGSIEIRLFKYFLKHKKLILASIILLLLLSIFAIIIKMLSTLPPLVILVGVIISIKLVAERWLFKRQRERQKTYYHDDYLKSDAWEQKRSLVLKRDGRRCVYCGAPASQVHHKRYARNIGREPIDWLISVCPACHGKQHNK